MCVENMCRSYNTHTRVSYIYNYIYIHLYYIYNFTKQPQHCRGFFFFSGQKLQRLLDDPTLHDWGMTLGVLCRQSHYSTMEHLGYSVHEGLVSQNCTILKKNTSFCCMMVVFMFPMSLFMSVLSSYPNCLCLALSSIRMNPQNQSIQHIYIYIQHYFY